MSNVSEVTQPTEDDLDDFKWLAERFGEDTDVGRICRAVLQSSDADNEETNS